jgi:hypothetical protein
MHLAVVFAAMLSLMFVQTTLVQTATAATDHNMLILVSPPETLSPQPPAESLPITGQPASDSLGVRPAAAPISHVVLNADCAQEAVAAPVLGAPVRLFREWRPVRRILGFERRQARRAARGC